MYRNNAIKQPRFIIDLLLAGLFLFLITDQASSKNERFAFNFGLQTVYDDNILDYSDADLDLLDDPSVPNNRYGIKSKDDFIFIPELEIIYKTRLAGHSLHTGVRGRYYYYKENDIKRYFKVEGFFKRFFNKRTYIQGTIGYLPDYYYRNSYSAADGYQEAKFDKFSLEAKLSYQLNNYITTNFSYTYANKNFIPLFDERDIKEHEFQGQAIYYPAKYWKSWFSYSFITAFGAGANSIQFKRDTSFDANLLTFGSRWYLKGLKKKGFELAGQVSYKIVYFQTSKVTVEDRYRLGREDSHWYVTLMARHAINSKFNVGVNFKKTTKTVSLPAQELKDFLESSSNSVYIILDYSL
jgi:hypothetical protein